MIAESGERFYKLDLKKKKDIGKIHRRPNGKYGHFFASDPQRLKREIDNTIIYLQSELELERGRAGARVLMYRCGRLFGIGIVTCGIPRGRRLVTIAVPQTHVFSYSFSLPCVRAIQMEI
jgi:hypothetical protein